jgi:hypothetical protein
MQKANPTPSQPPRDAPNEGLWRELMLASGLLRQPPPQGCAPQPRG